MLILFLLGSVTGCASTVQTPRTAAERIAQAMRDRGVDLANLRAIPVRRGEAERIVENIGFDIPGISIENGEPAGTIRIYKGEREAEADRRIYGLLGVPGPETKLDYVTVTGERGLILDHRLPRELAQRYIAAFESSPQEVAQ